jgi:hypothetical protein
MATRKSTKKQSAAPEEMRDRWLRELRALIIKVEDWARDLDWCYRRIERKMEDSQIGAYKAPALLLQKETIRVLMEPIARSAPGVEGLVDLYLLPAYDDIASLYHYGGGWHVHYPFPGDTPAGNIRDTGGRPLSKDTFRQVLEELVSHAE